MKTSTAAYSTLMLCWKYLIQCKISYTSATYVFFTLFILYTQNLSCYHFFLFEFVFGDHFELQNGCHFNLFQAVFAEQNTHSNIFVMIIISVVSRV